jgi:hypothetical protein
MASRDGMRHDRRVDSLVAPIPVPVPDRIRARIDVVRHPRLVRELARATGGFRARGVTRSYTNDLPGRRREAREAAILWHRGYRPPPTIIHNAMWWTGGLAIAIPYAREMARRPMTERQRRLADGAGLALR